MRMQFLNIPATGNFRVRRRANRNGVKVTSILRFIKENSPDSREIGKSYATEIRKTDAMARRTNDPGVRERAKEKLRKIVMEKLNTRERQEVVTFSTIVHTYPYICEDTEKEVKAWIADSTVEHALFLKGIMRENTKGLKILEGRHGGRKAE